MAKPKGQKATPAGKAETFKEDPFPRAKPPEREEPPNWKMAALSVEQAAVALKGNDRDSAIRDNVGDHLKAALKFLYPEPAEL